MALINCPECGKEISNKADFCPFCGYTDKVLKNHKPKISISKKTRIILVLVVVVVFIITSVVIVSTALLSGEEKYALDCVEELRSTLKNPDSLKIGGDIFIYEGDYWNSNKDTEYPIKFAVINYSASNTYGGEIKNIAVFSDEYGYLGDEQECVYGEGGQEAIQYEEAKAYNNMLELIGEDFFTDSKVTLVDGSTIAKKAKCNYYEY